MSLYITVVCDECKVELKTAHFGIHDAEVYAVSQGWDAGIRKKDLCPKCKPGPRAEQKGTE